MIVLYGKIKKGWQLCHLRRSNGMVALTPTLKDPWWVRWLVVPFYHNGKQRHHYNTTFTFGVNGYKEQFG